jgi:hypothetical protein
LPEQAIFLIKGVRVEKYGSKPDWTLSRPELKKVPVETRIRLSLYATFQSLSPGTNVSVALRVSHAGHPVFRSGLTDVRSGSGRLWDHWNFTPRSPGKYLVTGRLTVGRETEQVATSFTANLVPSVTTFTFKKLQSFDAQGHPATSFARTDRVRLVATFVVHHGAGTVRVTATQQLEYSNGSAWVPLGQPVQNIFDVSNGRHHYTVSFVPQSPYSLLRMVITLRIDGKSQSKAVIIGVHA